MAAERVYDFFNGAIGATRVTGPVSLDFAQSYIPVRAVNDGVTGPAMVAQGQFQGRWSLAMQDVARFATFLSDFESNAGIRAVAADTIRAGAPTTGRRVTLTRCVLGEFSLTCRQNEPAQVTMGGPLAAAAASDSLEDEVTITALGSLSPTFQAGGRAYRLAVPNYASTVQPEGIVSLELRGQPLLLSPVGEEWGVPALCAGWALAGRLVFRDWTITAAFIEAQRLLNVGTLGSLVVALSGQGATHTLTLANAIFPGAQAAIRARDLAGDTAEFELAGLNGSTGYALASGANKLITIVTT